MHKWLQMRTRKICICLIIFASETRTQRNYRKLIQSKIELVLVARMGVVGGASNRCLWWGQSNKITICTKRRCTWPNSNLLWHWFELVNLFIHTARVRGEHSHFEHTVSNITMVINNEMKCVCVFLLFSHWLCVPVHCVPVVWSLTI